MQVIPTSQVNQPSTVQKQKEELKAVEEKRASERAEKIKAQKEADLKPQNNKTNLAKGLGKKIDVTA